MLRGQVNIYFSAALFPVIYSVNYFTTDVLDEFRETILLRRILIFDAELIHCICAVYRVKAIFSARIGTERNQLLVKYIRGVTIRASFRVQTQINDVSATLHLLRSKVLFGEEKDGRGENEWKTDERFRKDICRVSALIFSGQIQRRGDVRYAAGGRTQKQRISAFPHRRFIRGSAAKPLRSTDGKDLARPSSYL